MSFSPRVAVLAVVGVVLALSAGCNSESAEEPSSSAVAAPAAAALTDGPVNKAEFLADLLSAIDQYDSVHLSVRAGTTASGEVDISYPDKTPWIHVDADTALRGPSRFVIAGGVVYIEQSQGGKWAVIDQSDPSYGALLRTFTEIGPHESVAGLGKGIISVTRDGTRRVDGAELTAYRLEVDPSRARGAFKALAGNSGISEVFSFEFLLDEDDLLHRVEVTVTGETTTVSLTDWGVPVSEVVPSGDQLITE